MPSAFPIRYAVQTPVCTFFLDEEGICQDIVLASGHTPDAARLASRCIGAQYVASLDVGTVGGLIEMPRVGAALLFATVDDRGRIAIVRTGIVVRFESRTRESNPFLDVDSVETSAMPFASCTSFPEPPQEEDEEDDYFDPMERTQQIRRYDALAQTLPYPDDDEAGLPSADVPAPGHSGITLSGNSPRDIDTPASSPAARRREA